MSRCIHNCVNFARTIRNNAKLFANSNQLRISQFSLRKQSRGRFNGLFSEISEFGTSRKREKKNEKPGARWTSRCVVDVEPGVGYNNNMKCITWISFSVRARGRSIVVDESPFIVSDDCWAVKCAEMLCHTSRSINGWMNEWTIHRIMRAHFRFRQWPFDRVKIEQFIFA